MAGVVPAQAGTQEVSVRHHRLDSDLRATHASRGIDGSRLYFAGGGMRAITAAHFFDSPAMNLPKLGPSA